MKSKKEVKWLWKGKWIYREVAFWPEDSEKLERISGRLEKFYKNAEIMHLEI